MRLPRHIDEFHRFKAFLLEAVLIHSAGIFEIEVFLSGHEDVAAVGLGQRHDLLMRNVAGFKDLSFIEADNVDAEHKIAELDRVLESPWRGSSVLEHCHESAHIVVGACQSYVAGDVRNALMVLRTGLEGKVDPHVLEEAAVAAELLCAKLANVSAAASACMPAGHGTTSPAFAPLERALRSILYMMSLTENLKVTTRGQDGEAAAGAPPKV